jgi:hypothetical protein
MDARDEVVGCFWRTFFVLPKVDREELALS